MCTLGNNGNENLFVGHTHLEIGRTSRSHRVRSHRVWWCIYSHTREDCSDGDRAHQTSGHARKGIYFDSHRLCAADDNWLSYSAASQDTVRLAASLCHPKATFLF